MAQNNMTIDFYYRDGFDYKLIEVTVVELGEIQWNQNNTQPFNMSGNWQASWAEGSSYYDLIEPGTNLRTLDVGNIATLYLNPSDGARGITCDQRVSELVGYTRFQFGILYTPGDITAICNETHSKYSTIYIAHAVIDGSDEYGFLGWGTDPDYWNYHSPMFIFNGEFSNWIALYVNAPGKKGYKPTATKYTPSTKPDIGGKGTNPDPGKNPSYETDDITNPSAPDESVASVIGAGLIHAYDIDTSNLRSLSTCLYGTTLGGLITNLSINPLDFVVSLNIFPCKPSESALANVILGRWVCTDSGIDSLGGNVEGKPLASQYKTIDFGTVKIPENWGSFLDYTHTEIELYLPFIGVISVDPSEVMDGDIALSYTIDFLTGMCVANVNCNRTVELPDGRTKYQKSQHSYQGNCAVSVPLSQQQYGNMIGSMINAGVAGMKGGVLGAGISIASDVASGGFKPTVTTKGSITANAGFCSVLYPYVRVVRPISAVSSSFQEVMGYPSYIDSKLGDCEDLCICDSIDLRSISGATASELERIKDMCMSGVHV